MQDTQADPPSGTTPQVPLSLRHECSRELERLRAAGLGRRLRPILHGPGAHVAVDGRALVSFAGNDYLGLALDPRLVEAAARAAGEFGAGAGASRLVTGSVRLFHELEEALAGWQGSEASLLFGSGYAAATGTIAALAGRGDYVVVDRLVHACCIDGVRLGGATLRVFRHNDPDHLDHVLRRVCRAGRRVLVVTEAVFSMDGDTAPLEAIVDVKDRHGAWLMLDEAHSTGLFGPALRGLAAARRLHDRVEIHLGTLGKAIGAAGGFISGPGPLIGLLTHRARSLVYSTAPVPAAAGAALRGLEILSSDEGLERSSRTWATARRIAGILGVTASSAIIPVILGAEDRASRAAAALESAGLLVPAIRFPTVARGEARLRFTASACHTEDDLGLLARSRALIHQEYGA